MKNKTLNILLNIFIAIAFVGLVAWLSSIFTDPNSQWHTELNKPSTFMPNWVFPILWSTIYSLMAITIFLLLQRNEMTLELILLFIINGALQILWSYVYFTKHNIFGGLIIIGIVTAFAVLLVYRLFEKDVLYGYLLTIYPMWLFLATCLNLSTWILN